MCVRMLMSHLLSSAAYSHFYCAMHIIHKRCMVLRKKTLCDSVTMVICLTFYEECSNVFSN
jgi:hypothetical protein